MSSEKYFTYLSADKKHQVSAKWWIPEEQPKAILQIAHGMVEFKERYDDFAKFLNQNGILVAANDHLGHGDTAQTPEDFGYIAIDHPSDLMVADLQTLREMTAAEYPNLPYIMLGHSMGSYLLRKYLAKYGKGLSGAIVMGTGHEPAMATRLGLFLTGTIAKFHGWNHRSSFIQNMTYEKPYKQYDVTGKDPDNSWLSRDRDKVIAYYKEPKCTFQFTLTGHKALFEMVQYVCDPVNIKKIPATLPILLISGEADPVGNLGEGVKTVYQMFLDAGLSQTTLKLYPGARHEILNEINRQEVYEDILAWLTKLF